MRPHPHPHPWLLASAAIIVPSLVSSGLGLAGPAWIGPALGLALALAVLVISRRWLGTRGTWGTWVIGTLLSVLTPHLVAQAKTAWSFAKPTTIWPSVDLIEGGEVPANATAIHIRGYLRPAWSLDEYRVADKQRPDQNVAAPYRLIPLLANAEASTSEARQLVVARIVGTMRMEDTPVELTGALSPLAPEITRALVNFDRGLSPDHVEAFLLDTVELPTSTQACIAVLVAMFVALSAGITLGAAASTGRER